MNCLPGRTKPDWEQKVLVPVSQSNKNSEAKDQGVKVTEVSWKENTIILDSSWWRHPNMKRDKVVARPGLLGWHRDRWFRAATDALNSCRVLKTMLFQTRGAFKPANGKSSTKDHFFQEESPMETETRNTRNKSAAAVVQELEQLCSTLQRGRNREPIR